jgi:hypothetical protein
VDVAHLDWLPTFADGDVFRVVVESPRGSTVKVKYDTALKVMSIEAAVLLRFASTALEGKDVHVLG